MGICWSLISGLLCYSLKPHVLRNKKKKKKHMNLNSKVIMIMIGEILKQNTQINTLTKTNYHFIYC